MDDNHSNNDVHATYTKATTNHGADSGTAPDDAAVAPAVRSVAGATAAAGAAQPVVTDPAAVERMPHPGVEDSATDAGAGDTERAGEQPAEVGEEPGPSVSEAEVKSLLDAAREALEALADAAGRGESVWAASVAKFATDAVASVPKLPTLRDLTTAQRFAAVGSLATVAFAKRRGRYLVVAIDEDAGKATVVQPATNTVLTSMFSTVTVDPAARVFDAAALAG